MDSEGRKNLLIANSLKGGGGKSTFSCILLDYMRKNNHEIAAYDADGAVGSLFDMHAERDDEGIPLAEQDPLTGVVDYNIRNESRELLINSLQYDHSHILHDVAGGALADLQRLFSDVDSLKNLLRAMSRSNTNLTFFHLVTPDISTVESIALHLDLTEKLPDRLRQHAQHIAVLNMQGGRTLDDFPRWFGYRDERGNQYGGKTRHRLFESGGAEMCLPALTERTMTLVKDAKITFAAATSDNRLSLVDQERVFNFCEDFDEAMTPEVKNMIGLAS